MEIIKNKEEYVFKNIFGNTKIREEYCLKFNHLWGTKTGEASIDTILAECICGFNVEKLWGNRALWSRTIFD